MNCLEVCDEIRNFVKLKADNFDFILSECQFYKFDGKIVQVLTADCLTTATIKGRRLSKCAVGILKVNKCQNSVTQSAFFLSAAGKFVTKSVEFIPFCQQRPECSRRNLETI